MPLQRKRSAAKPAPPADSIAAASDGNVGLVLKAVAFAAEKHRDQRRKNAEASPYINHPIALASLLQEQGVDDVPVLCAPLLHDPIEDTNTSADELRREFGDEITDVVLEVTDDKNLAKAERKR